MHEVIHTRQSAPHIVCSEGCSPLQRTLRFRHCVRAVRAQLSVLVVRGLPRTIESRNVNLSARINIVVAPGASTTVKVRVEAFCGGRATSCLYKRIDILTNQDASMALTSSDLADVDSYSTAMTTMHPSTAPRGYLINLRFGRYVGQPHGTPATLGIGFGPPCGR